MLLEKNFHIFCNSLLKEGDKIVIGFSGGLDSTVLFSLLSGYLQKHKSKNISLSPVLFHHKNSPIEESQELIAFCKKQSKDFGFNLLVHEITMDKGEQSWESIGRIGRMNFYKNSGATHVFLGHHLDDQIETIFSQMLRGAGRGMLGMKKTDQQLVRPLLDFTKEEIRLYAIAKNIPWFEDPLNKNNHFTRNFWRNEILPKLETHYPSYRKKIHNLATKIENERLLNLDLAKIDGLEKILSGEQLDVSNLSERRIKNLLSNFFHQSHCSIESAKLNEFVKNLLTDKMKNGTITKNNTTLSYQKNKGNITIGKNLIPSPKDNPKKSTP